MTRLMHFLTSLTGSANRNRGEYSANAMSNDTVAARLDALGAAEQDDYVPPLRPRLRIPVVESTEEERVQSAHHEQGLFLARQDRWEDLSRLIREFDSKRANTPGGTSIASLLAQGARTDFVAPAQFGGDVPQEAGPGAAEVEQLLAEYPEDPSIGLIAAYTHIDLAWVARGEGDISDLPPKDHETLVRHFDRAGEILDRFNPFEHDMPILAAARCAAMPGDEKASVRISDAYEDLIELDPETPAHMRGLGNHLLPRWFGSYTKLNVEARRTAARTSDIWGAGGYAWVYMDALLVDERAYEQLDAGFFLDGVHDILERCRNQHMANVMAAYLGVSTRVRPAQSGDRARIEANRAKLVEAFGEVLESYVREIHPIIWIEAADRFEKSVPLERAKLLRQGSAQAYARLARHYADVIEAGQMVNFGPEGVSISPAI